MQKRKATIACQPRRSAFTEMVSDFSVFYDNLEFSDTRLSIFILRQFVQKRCSRVVLVVSFRGQQKPIVFICRGAVA